MLGGEGHYQPFGRDKENFNSIMNGEDCWEWVGTKADFEAYAESLKEKWMPDVWQECEYESGETESGWDICTLEGSTRVGNVISSARYSTGKLISKEVKFRPIKTERERFENKIRNLIDASKTLQSATTEDISSFTEMLWQEGLIFDPSH